MSKKSLVALTGKYTILLKYRGGLYWQYTNFLKQAICASLLYPTKMKGLNGKIGFL
jgi:hypothetical protein